MSFGESNPYASPTAAGDVYVVATPGDGLATRMERFAGAFLDGIILGIIVFPLGMLLGFGMAMNGVREQNPLVTSVFSFVIGLGAFLIVNGYLLSTRGQTVGKYFVKTRIVSDEGRQLNFQELVLKRYLPLYVGTSLPLIGGLVWLVDVLAIFRENRKCIHDEIAGTKVIKVTQS